MVFDAHFHILPEEIYSNASFYNESWGGLEQSIARMDESGVDRAVVSYPTTDYHVRKGFTTVQASRAYNSEIKRVAEAAGGRLDYLAAIPLTETGEMLAEARLSLDEGAVGFTVPTNQDGLYPDDVRFRPFFAEVEHMGTPVFFHPTTLTPFGHEKLRHPLITPVFQYAFDTTLCLAKVVDSGLLSEYPKLKLVFASFGGAMPFFAGRFDRTYRMLLGRGIVKDLGEDPGATLRKVYVDTSGATSPALLDLAVEVFGSDKVLWGSDFPANREIKASIDAIYNLNITEKAKEQVLGLNLCYLFEKR